MNVAVVGLGYVGAVTSACLAELGHSVVGVDIDGTKVSVMKEGRGPVVEPGLDDLIAAGRASRRLDVTTDLEAAVQGTDVVLVCVGTPARSDGTVDLAFVERVTDEIGIALSRVERHCTIVYRSTVPPGTVRTRLLPVLEKSSGRRVGEGGGVAMVPEFLREGSGIEDFFNPAFTVAGVIDDASRQAVEALFEPLPAPFYATTLEAAEALKYACNAYHALKVTFANEIARILGATGVDARSVMEVFCEDDRLNISAAYLRPGFAFGGSCLPKDLRALMHIARVHDVDTPMLSGITRSNESHVQLAVRRVLDRGDRDVALLGLSFKAATDDLRESPFVELAETLLGKGMRLRIYDPIVNPERLIGANRRYVEGHLPHLREMLASTPVEALQGVGVVVVGTSDEDAIKAVLDARPNYVLDLHGRLGAEFEALPGYEGIAW